MTDDPEDHDKDAELSRRLQDAPPLQVPARLNERVAASYRRARPPSRRWRPGAMAPWPRRLWRVRVSLPAPVAALALLTLFAAGTMARDIRWPRFGGETRAASGLAGLRPLAEVQIRVASKEGR